MALHTSEGYLSSGQDGGGDAAMEEGLAAGSRGTLKELGELGCGGDGSS